jgi:hypothetical protein
MGGGAYFNSEPRAFLSTILRDEQSGVKEEPLSWVLREISLLLLFIHLYEYMRDTRRVRSFYKESILCKKSGTPKGYRWGRIINW